MPPRARKPPAPELVVIRRNIDELVPDPANARMHSERNIAAIQASLRRFGQRKPIVIDSRDVVVAGNGTLEAAKREQWESIECVVYPGTPAEARAFALADNRTAELASWDQGVLMEALETLSPDMQLDAGWTPKELEQLFSGETHGGTGDAGGDEGPDVWGVIVTCQTEEQQRDLMSKLDEEGFTVRAMIQ